MKNILTAISSIVFIMNIHAQNTFPATGNVGIGTLTPGVSALYIQGSNTDGGATNSPLINVINTSTFNPAGSGANCAWMDLTAGNGAVASQIVCSYGTQASGPFNGGSGLYLTTRTSHPIIFATGATTTEKMRLTSAGNLGIGVTNPCAQLSFPDVYATGTVGITWYNATGDPTLYGIHKTAGAWSPPNYQQIRIGWATGIVLDPGNAYGLSYVNVMGNGLRVTSGTVGIGTVSTNDVNFKLFVETGIRTRKITVDQIAWPDYVFEPAYSLLPLKSLKAFVKINKHLPGIASAEEVEKNGVDLGANQAAILKKVEELTLYILEQDKQIKILQADIAELKGHKKNKNVSR